ncbi:MAG: hypothetical protein PHE09_16485, partial [Oscillospiraceae bacterium]|nr:hypothetical protein [Oscillospiraceae bacterium]
SEFSRMPAYGTRDSEKSSKQYGRMEKILILCRKILQIFFSESTAVYAAQYMCMKRLGVEPETVMLTQKVIPPRTKQIVKFGNSVTVASALFL